jgi:hypothetical protein
MNMEFLKKYWYLPVILALILFIITMPKKTYKVVPKDNVKKDSMIISLRDSLDRLIIENNQLNLVEKEIVRTETLKVNVPSKPKEIIIYKNQWRSKSDGELSLPQKLPIAGCDNAR